MKTTKTIPFDWELYNSNRDKYKVVTKGGDEVTQLTYFESHNDYKLAGVTTGHIETWIIDGMYYQKTRDCCLNLQLQYEEEVRESWVNLYKTENGCVITDNLFYSNKEQAIKASNEIMNCVYIKTINLNDL